MRRLVAGLTGRGIRRRRVRVEVVPPGEGDLGARWSTVARPPVREARASRRGLPEGMTGRVDGRPRVGTALGGGLAGLDEPVVRRLRLALLQRLERIGEAGRPAGVHGPGRGRVQRAGGEVGVPRDVDPVLRGVGNRVPVEDRRGGDVVAELCRAVCQRLGARIVDWSRLVPVRARRWPPTGASGSTVNVPTGPVAELDSRLRRTPRPATCRCLRRGSGSRCRWPPGRAAYFDRIGRARRRRTTLPVTASPMSIR